MSSHRGKSQSGSTLPDCVDMELNFAEAITIYRLDHVLIQKIPLVKDWTEAGQLFPTIYAKQTPYVAAKSFSCDKSCLAEYMLLRDKKHTNIVEAFGLQHNSSSPTLPFMYIMEVGECSLYHLLHNETQATQFPTDTEANGDINQYSMGHALLWNFQLSDALEFLHGANILHRDVKSPNILLFNGGLVVKLCDFGLGRQLTSNSKENLTPYVGTQLWMSPEISEGTNNYNQTSDCYSLGVVMLETVFRHSPQALLNLPDNLEKQLDKQIQWHRNDRIKVLELSKSPFKYEVHKTVLDSLSDILNSLLTANKDARITASQLKAQLAVLKDNWGREPKQRTVISPAVDIEPLASNPIVETVSSVSTKSESVFYEFDVKCQQDEVDEIRARVETVLNALGERTNKRVNPRNPFSATHKFQILNTRMPEKPSASDPARLYIEHRISDNNSDNTKKLRDYCKTNEKHVEWLVKLFEEENLEALSSGLEVRVKVSENGNNEC